jgi:hypothetical protein
MIDIRKIQKFYEENIFAKRKIIIIGFSSKGGHASCRTVEPRSKEVIKTRL